jgi:hypothetical protein
MIRELASSGVPSEDALEHGERLARAAPLAVTHGAGGHSGALGDGQRGPSGWPFASHYLEQAVLRGYAHLGIGVAGAQP